MAAAAARRLSPSLLPLLMLLLLDVGRAAAAAASSAHPSLYIAANFRDNAATVPTFTAELLKLAADVGPSNLFATVYESGSVDSTPRLLDDARRSLEAAGVATNITANGPLTRRGRQRIDFLADTRNELLKPLRCGCRHDDNVCGSMRAAATEPAEAWARIGRARVGLVFFVAPGRGKNGFLLRQRPTKQSCKI